MKKLLTAVLALTAATTFAANENMVRFTNPWDSVENRSFDVSFGTTESENGVDEADTATNNIALNYARAFGQWQVGLTYKNYTDSTGDDVTIGLSGYYNMESDLTNTCYFGLHYTTMTEANDDVTNSIGLEYGHRWNVGSAWGMTLTYAPSVVFTQATTEYDADNTEDQVATGLAWNWVKFDVLF